jgi:hypothetical protein
MPSYNGTRVLTVGKFDQTRAVVQDWFSKHLPGVDWPTPYKPGHEGPMWVLSLEGVGDWPIDITQDESVEWPAGVFAEPVNSWCLGLYPAPDPAEASTPEELAKNWERAVAQDNQWAQQKIGARMARYLREH